MKRDAADAAFSDAIRHRNDWKCENCGLVCNDGIARGKSWTMQCAHIYSRRSASTRWDSRNALCLCAACHRLFGDRPLDFAAYVENRFGAAFVAELRARNLEHYRKPDRKAIAKHYRAEIKRIQKERAAGNFGRIELRNWEWW